jgi:hypothetical protein
MSRMVTPRGFVLAFPDSVLDDVRMRLDVRLRASRHGT